MGSSTYNFLPYAFRKGDFVPFVEANVSVATHALHYGTAAFGGLRGVVKEGKTLLFRLDRHCARLSASARYLGADYPSNFFEDVISRFVALNKPESNFYIRPLVFTSDLGIAPRLHSIEYDVVVYGLLLGDYLPPEGVSCRFSSWYRSEDRSVPGRGKISGSYITSSLAKTEAVSSGFEEAIMLNAQGKVSEATGMNLFMVKDGVLVTPSEDQDILVGITRASIMELAQDLGIPVQQRPVDKGEVIQAQEVFLSGTAARITPVNKVEQYIYSTERPITNLLKEKLFAIIEGRDPKYQKWITTISHA
jgi:branched-chain amino acid aminotransferase